MTIFQRIVVKIFNQVVRFYPSSFRSQFGNEMNIVFSNLIEDSSNRGKAYVIKAFLLEIRDAPLAILSAYWYDLMAMMTNMLDVIFHGETKPGLNVMERSDCMSGEGSSGNWQIEKRRELILASIPPFIYGAGITFSWLVIGSRWYEIPRWQLYAGMSIGVIAASIIAVGAIIALIKGMPVWGYTWLGSAVIGFILLIQTTVEELQESGYTISPAVNDAGNIIVLLIILSVIGITVRRGWQQAGLVSIGFASIMGLSLIHAIVIPPFSRIDLVYVSIALGLLTSLLIYFYIKAFSGVWKFVLLITVGFVNFGMAAIASSAWQSWLSSNRRPSPLLPLIFILSGLLLSGPVLGLITQSIQRGLKRA